MHSARDRKRTSAFGLTARIGVGLVVSIAIAGGILAWLFWQQSRPRPLTVSGFIEADDVRVGSRVGGRLAEVHVSEGQSVTRGQKLFTLDPFDLRERLAQAKADLAGSKAELDRMKSGYRTEEIEQARAKRDRAAALHEKLKAGPRHQEIESTRQQLKIAEANLELAKSEFARVERLQKESQAAPTEFDQAVRTLKSAEASAAAAREILSLATEGSRKEDIAEAAAALAEAQQAATLLEKGYRVEEVARAQANADAAAATVAAIEIQLTEMQVLSPCDCVVEAVDLRPGDIVGPNAPAIALLETHKMWIRAYVPEARLGQVQLGRHVAVHVDGQPQQSFEAVVTYIAREAEFTPRNVQTPEERSKQVFRIKAELTAKLETLRVGMSADLMFDEPISK
jgi:multidrug resistance efflux pump